MDEVTCLGNESGLSQCQYDRWGIPIGFGFGYCQHSEEASVVCSRSKSDCCILALKKHGHWFLSCKVFFSRKWLQYFVHTYKALKKDIWWLTNFFGLYIWQYYFDTVLVVH